MIDQRTIKFFQSLPKLTDPDKEFFEPAFDIFLNELETMYDVAQKVVIPPRVRKPYRWYLNDTTNGFNSVDLCNIDGVPAHDQYKKMFTNEELEQGKISWQPEHDCFKRALEPIGKQWRWVMLVRIDPMGYWAPHLNIPGINEHDYKLYWIPLNYDKHRYFAASDVGYFEPRLGTAYIQKGHIYTYSTINLSNTPMYNLAGVAQ